MTVCTISILDYFIGDVVTFIRHDIFTNIDRTSPDKLPQLKILSIETGIRLDERLDSADYSSLSYI